MDSKEELENRVKRLEDKNKRNFFEMEKRLTKLESTSSIKSVEQLEERLYQLEDLQMMLEMENLKLKEQWERGGVKTGKGGGYSREEIRGMVKDELKGQSPKGSEEYDHSEIEKHITILEGKIKGLKKKIGKMSTLDSQKKFREEKEELERKLESMKEALSGKDKIAEKINKLEESDVWGLKKEIESIKKRMESLNISKLENKMRAIEDKVDVTDISELEGELQSIKERIPDKETFVRKSELERRIKDKGLSSHQKEELQNLRERLYDVEEEFNKSKEELEHEIHKHSYNVDALKEKMEKRSARTNMDEVDKRMEKQENRLSSFEKKIENKIAGEVSNEIGKFAKKIEKKMPYVSDFDEFKERVNNLEEMVAGLSNKIPKQEKTDVQKVKDLEDEVERLNRIIKRLGNRLPVVVE